MIKKVDHIAIAVHSLEEALPFYQQTLGLHLEKIEDVPSQKVRVAMLAVGDCKFELLEPTEPDSPISKFLDRRGPGLHHVALSTDNLEQRLRDFEERDVALLDKTPRVGAENKLVAFMHPKASGGVLLEFCQPQEVEP